MTVKGTMIASAVAGLFAAGAPAVVFAKDSDSVKCMGINGCKGKAECKSATTSCKGMNECKGKGWVQTTDKECKAKKGTVVTGGH